MKEKLINSTSTPNSKDATKSNSQTTAIIIAIVAGVVLLILAFFLNGNSTAPTSNETTEEVISAHCTASECIKQIETTDSPEKITEIIGVEPEVDEASGRHKWQLSSKESITLEKSSGGHTLQATIDKTTIANDKADFSSFSELKKTLEGGESFTYDELVAKLGGVEGTLAGKTSTSKRYIWVDDQDRTFAATFSDNNDGKCSIISLR